MAQFYMDVFDCRPVPPERDQSGAWLDKGLNLPNAHLQGVHLRLPGHGPHGPTLEIYSYDEVLPSETGAPHRRGYGHLAFEVDDVAAIYDRLLAHGGQRWGSVSERAIPGLGTITFVYAKDPDGNLIELQHWTLDKGTEG